MGKKKKSKTTKHKKKFHWRCWAVVSLVRGVQGLCYRGMAKVGLPVRLLAKQGKNKVNASELIYTT